MTKYDGIRGVFAGFARDGSGPRPISVARHIELRCLRAEKFSAERERGEPLDIDDNALYPVEWVINRLPVCPNRVCDAVDSGYLKESDSMFRGGDVARWLSKQSTVTVSRVLPRGVWRVREKPNAAKPA